jgi:YD repeat-containing protein
VVEPLACQTAYGFDDDDRLTRTEDPTGVVATTVYDAAGRAVHVLRPLSIKTTVAYDKLNCPTALTDPTGRTTTTQYDPGGRSSSSSSAGRPGPAAGPRSRPPGTTTPTG